VIVAPIVPTDPVDCTTTDPPPPPPGDVGELPPHAVVTINAAMLAAAKIRVPKVTVYPPNSQNVAVPCSEELS
jgi:hypothetical protein